MSCRGGVRCHVELGWGGSCRGGVGWGEVSCRGGVWCVM